MPTRKSTASAAAEDEAHAPEPAPEPEPKSVSREPRDDTLSVEVRAHTHMVNCERNA